MKRVGVVIIFILVLVGGVKSQDTHFSQYFAAPLYLSPSMAGALGNANATTVNFDFSEMGFAHNESLEGRTFGLATFTSEAGDLAYDSTHGGGIGDLPAGDGSAFTRGNHLLQSPQRIFRFQRNVHVLSSFFLLPAFFCTAYNNIIVAYICQLLFRFFLIFF